MFVCRMANPGRSGIRVPQKLQDLALVRLRRGRDGRGGYIDGSDISPGRASGPRYSVLERFEQLLGISASKLVCTGVTSSGPLRLEQGSRRRVRYSYKRSRSIGMTVLAWVLKPPFSESPVCGGRPRVVATENRSRRVVGAAVP